MHGNRNMLRVDTKENEMDMLTKPLPVQTYIAHRDTLGVRNVSELKSLPEHDQEIDQEEWNQERSLVVDEDEDEGSNEAATGIRAALRACPARSLSVLRDPANRDYARRFLLYVWNNRRIVARACGFLQNEVPQQRPPAPT